MYDGYLGVSGKKLIHDYIHLFFRTKSRQGGLLRKLSLWDCRFLSALFLSLPFFSLNFKSQNAHKQEQHKVEGDAVVLTTGGYSFNTEMIKKVLL